MHWRIVMQAASINIPDVFPSPFENQPHALAVQAALELQARLPSLTSGLHDFTRENSGKMLGVLVVRDRQGRLDYLSGFSGMLGGRWLVDGFVPPVFDYDTFVPLLKAGEATLDQITQELHALQQSSVYKSALQQHTSANEYAVSALRQLAEQHRARKQHRHSRRQSCGADHSLMAALAQQSRDDKRQRQQLQREIKVLQQQATQQLQPVIDEITALKRRRQSFSSHLQRQLFDCYVIPGVGVDPVPLRHLFTGSQPPGGAGDCAAVKLLNAAIKQQLTPICLAEFWWGRRFGLRQHGQFYPACRSKCRPILPHMLGRLPVSIPVHEQQPDFAADLPATIYQDNDIVIINKPHGMLSVPGQSIVDSVEARLRQRYPQTDNKTLLLHRLDQATSGVMLAAKNARAYKALQHQFQSRTVDKTYLAEVSSTQLADQGQITLPLRVDLEDRPRQIVCYQHGKSSLTHFKVLQVGDHSSLVEFKPVTGRTHQLRVHAAHPHGLNAPILGDELYGHAADRLHLHAKTLSFTHPLTGCRVSFSAPVPFLTSDAE